MSMNLMEYIKNNRVKGIKSMFGREIGVGISNILFGK